MEREKKRKQERCELYDYEPLIEHEGKYLIYITTISVSVSDFLNEQEEREREKKALKSENTLNISNEHIKTNKNEKDRFLYTKKEKRTHSLIASTQIVNMWKHLSAVI